MTVGTLVTPKPLAADSRQELRAVAEAIRMHATLLRSLPPGDRLDAAVTLYRNLQARLDSMAGADYRT